MMDSTVSVVPIERITFLTGRPFDEVVSDIYAGLGRTRRACHRTTIGCCALSPAIRSR